MKKNQGEIALELEAVTPPITTDNQLVYLQTREIFVNRLKQQEKVFLAEKEDITEELSLAKDSYQKAKQKRMVIDKLRERNLNVFRSLQLRNQIIEEDDINTKRYWHQKKLLENRID